VRDSIFAEARRTFTEKRTKTKDDAAPATAQNSSTPSAIDGATERRMMRDLDRHLTKLGLADKISPTQYARAERDLLAEYANVNDVGSWVKDYFEGYGAAPTAAAPSSTTQPQQTAPRQSAPQNERPVTDRGAPPASNSPLAEQDLYSMSDSDRLALIREKGPVWFREKLNRDSKGRKLSFGPG
jgi:hypothetical protein